MADRPALDEPVDNPTAVWVGFANVEDLNVGVDISLEGGLGFRRARLLIWQGDAVRGFVDVDVADGVVASDTIRHKIERLPIAGAALVRAAHTPTSIIVCTRDRPDDLLRCLKSLLALDYPEYEIIVVDSASRTTATKDVVESLAPASIEYYRSNQPGLARARNVGAVNALYDRLAFTDDDVVVDKRWLWWLNEGFAQASDIRCVTGLVGSGQLESDSQHYFDRRVTWASNVHQMAFRLAKPPSDVPLFPFQFGVYGTGANFALDRVELTALGGFDNALGAGSATGAGEDTDIFIRLILRGQALLYQPNAVVWHRHRLASSALTDQLENYGIGIGAVVAKLLSDSTARRMMIPLFLRGLKHSIVMVRVKTDPSPAGSEPGLRGNAARELLGLLRGPLALWRARRYEAKLSKTAPMSQNPR